MDSGGNPLEREAMIERRAVLRRMGLGAAAVASAGGLASALAACAGSGSGSTDAARSSTSSRPSTSASSATSAALALPAVTGSIAAGVQHFDPTKNFWDQGAFRAVTEEVESTRLTVQGAIPPELTGLYVRNGSNARSGTSPHWFLGDGMLHGLRIERGKAVWYRNRWVRTPLEVAGKSFSGIPGNEDNQSNVAVVHHGGKLLTTGEVGWPYELSTADLSTVGAYDFGGKLGRTMTAHPKVDPVTGRMHFFGYSFVEPFLSYYVADADGKLVLDQPIEVRKSSMIHDFAVTDRDAVFWEGPVLFGADGGPPGMPYGWDPSYGFRFGVMPIEGPTSSIRWIEMDPQYIFHGVNAHREGDDVVLTANRLDSAFKSGADAVTASPSITHRWRIGTGGKDLTIKTEVLTDVVMDLPTHDRRFTGRQNRHAWFATTGESKDWGFEFTGICHMDLKTGRTEQWEPSELERCGEAFFVPASAGAAEGEGWLLTYTYDRTTDRSALAILDAQDVAKGPVARVDLPVRVPFGFHGLWIADT